MRVTRIEPGTFVIIVLREPREKCWGVLDSINAAGVYLRGLDLLAFDDWMHAVAQNELFIGPTDAFFPMWRIERISRDETTGDIQSLAEQFERRTNRNVRAVLGIEPDINDSAPEN